jgi:hypothetical protein
MAGIKLVRSSLAARSAPFPGTGRARRTAIKNALGSRQKGGNVSGATRSGQKINRDAEASDQQAAATMPSIRVHHPPAKTAIQGWG